MTVPRLASARCCPAYAEHRPSLPHALHIRPTSSPARDGRTRSARTSPRRRRRQRFRPLPRWDDLANGDPQARSGPGDTVASRPRPPDQKPNVPNLPVAFALAAIPSRYALERGQWRKRPAWHSDRVTSRGRASRSPRRSSSSARGLGAARSGNLAQARDDQARLAALRDALLAAKVGDWADQVDIQRLLAAGSIARAEGRHDDALQLLRAAADREDATEKHPVTPGSIVPAREDWVRSCSTSAGRPRPSASSRHPSRSSQPPPRRLRRGARRGAVRRRREGRAEVRPAVALTTQADSERPEVTPAKAFLAKP